MLAEHRFSLAISLEAGHLWNYFPLLNDVNLRRLCFYQAGRALVLETLDDTASPSWLTWHGGRALIAVISREDAIVRSLAYNGLPLDNILERREIRLQSFLSTWRHTSLITMPSIRHQTGIVVSDAILRSKHHGFFVILFAMGLFPLHIDHTAGERRLVGQISSSITIALLAVDTTQRVIFLYLLHLLR